MLIFTFVYFHKRFLAWLCRLGLFAKSFVNNTLILPSVLVVLPYRKKIWKFTDHSVSLVFSTQTKSSIDFYLTFMARIYIRQLKIRQESYLKSSFLNSNLLKNTDFIYYCTFMAIKVWVKKLAHVKKFWPVKKSATFVKSPCNLVKMIASWGNHFHIVS